VEKRFSQNYELYYGYPEVFKIDYIAPGENTVKAFEMSPVAIDEINKHQVRGSELSLKLLPENMAALLTINTFAYYDRVSMFRAFIDSTFKVIRDQNIKNLILDLRGNDGGDPFCSSYVLSYLEQEPVPYFAHPYGRYTDLADPIPVAANNFTGNLYTLIDGSGFSTTGHFCALLKYHQIGKFVGSETGATYTCTGSVRYVDLAHTKLILGTARKRRYTAAVKNMDRTRGIIPNYQIEQSQRDIIEGRDTVLEYVLNLIRTHHESIN
jgi:C-terminal processing protease CtpA/Prc